MIEPMKFISITGPKEDFDRVIEQYISKYEIHLENALSELKTVQNLHPFVEPNPYKEALNKANSFLQYLPEVKEETTARMATDTAIAFINRINRDIVSYESQQQLINDEITNIKKLITMIEPFKELGVDLQTVFNFKFIKFRFGKISLEHYRRIERYLHEDVDSIFFKCHEDLEFVYGVYFVMQTLSQKTDAIYSSMHFERIELSKEYEGTPEQAYNHLNECLQQLEEEASGVRVEISKLLKESEDDLLAAKNQVEQMFLGFETRKLAACLTEENVTFYILCGWMAVRDEKQLMAELDADDNVFCVEEDYEEAAFQGPPTKIKNPKVFRPFEMFTRMYGIPSYNEMDPTIFIALTYTLIFGAMFGDVGQGLLLVIGGALIYAKTKNNLAAIISSAGIFSTIFGFLFGSVFGFEDIIEPLWLHPRSATTQVPMIGELNTVFVVAIALGMGLILLTMIFHIVNAIKSKDKEGLYFDTNGIAGIIFYGSAVVIIGLLMAGKAMPAGVLLVVMFIIPIILIALKEPLGNLIEKKAKIMPEEKGMFIVQTFFELFEVLLSYFSNTLSFIRVGAFAISHAAMMEVVLMLAGAEAGGSPNWIVIVFGNLFVCGLEGLIVGIQVLRLEYYEMFSRFYKGTGREFIPYKKNKTK